MMFPVRKRRVRRKLSTFVRSTVVVAGLGMAVSLPITTVWGADEDMSTSVYLVFDPDTGEFVTVDDPNRTKQHAADRDPANASGGISQSTGAGLSAPVLASAAVAIVLIGGAMLVWFRRGKSTK